MKRLVLSSAVYEAISVLARQHAHEFSATLFGEVKGDEYIVSQIAPPGPNAKCSFLTCTGDDEFEAEFFHELRKQKPGIRWLGDLHAHPPGCPGLSRRDRRTIRTILLGTDDALHPEEYIAGVILRTKEGIAIHARHFTKHDLKGSEMELCHGNFCAKS